MTQRGSCNCCSLTACNRHRKTSRRTTLAAQWAILACVALALTLTPAWGQSTASGTVVGQVTDATGSVIVGATVSLIDRTTGTTKSIKSNDVGRFVFVNVDPGAYDIVVEKTGFSSARFTRQEVSLGRQLTVNVTLNVGSVTEEVRV